MRINSIRVVGFRGFNEERVFGFHEKLTVISAPNSHGKTSVSEALEFLLYGSTSKVDKADSKDEYKDSYRNRHYPADRPAYIEAVMGIDPETFQVLRIELAEDGTLTKYVDGVTVDKWPFQEESDKAGRPFVLQHALKNLLLVAPVDRFKGFAELLGLNEVDSVFRTLISLCTKASASLPDEAHQLIADLARIKTKMELTPSLKGSAAGLLKGEDGVKEAFLNIEARADSFLTNEEGETRSRIERLESARTIMASKVYSGDIVVPSVSMNDAARLASSSSRTSSVTISTSSFTRSLTLGSTGADVKLLQEYLNVHGFTVAATGAGSLGHETTCFGKATRAALARFQKANGVTPAAGYFGSITRAYVSAHP